MRGFGKYISKNLIRFAILIVGILFLDILAFFIGFRNIVYRDYQETSPARMIEAVDSATSTTALSDDMTQTLRENHIWAMLLDESGNCLWRADVPPEVPEHYTMQNVAVFSKGYIAGYPVFIRCRDDGILVLGYPENSYYKLTGNYLSFNSIQKMPVFCTAMLLTDFLLLFAAYILSKRKIMKNTEPVITAIEDLSKSKPVTLNISGELTEIADCINNAAVILNRQNEARANWISGISHDIRTPLSMIMGYANRIANDQTSTEDIQKQAKIIEQQSRRIKELIQDLNLVSQLEYEMQPLCKTKLYLAGTIRAYLADLLNAGLPETHTVDIEISRETEIVPFCYDERLMVRALNNLVQNSILHNPNGCSIKIQLKIRSQKLFLIVSDDGIGLSAQKQYALEHTPHYMESTDARLDLRHGLGLVLVRQIIAAHDGEMEIVSEPGKGYKTIIAFPIKNIDLS